MRICVTSTGNDLDAPIDPRFGRARYFLLVDPDTLTVEALENRPGAHGAGVQATQLLANRGVSALVTGAVGPNAFNGLSAAGIEVYKTPADTGREALAAYREGRLARVDAPSSSGHRGGRT